MSSLSGAQFVNSVQRAAAEVSAPSQGQAPQRMDMSDPPRFPFYSVLFRTAEERHEQRTPPEFFLDLNVDQIIEGVTNGLQEYDLQPFFHTSLTEIDAISYRQEIMLDLEDQEVTHAVATFSQRMRSMRKHQEQVQKSYYQREKERWFLDAVEIYCTSVECLCQDLAQSKATSRGLRSFRLYLSDYLGTSGFKDLAARTRKLTADLSSVRYNLLIKEGKVTVRRCDDEIDYSAAVEQTFEKFRRGAPKDYLAELPSRTGMNHIQAQILEGVAQLYPDIFRALSTFSIEHAEYADDTVKRFDREIQFYVSYLQYIKQFRRAGLSFCYPRLSQTSKELIGSDTFDMALAGKRIKDRSAVVINSFFLRGAERTFVVSGPNQGGKTTFARTFGQLHYLASLGCPVPGSEAQLFLFDQIFTHFEREEDITNLRGKLHDDLLRIHRILERATPSSIVIMNELFSSTTLKDAVYLSKKIMTAMSDRDLLGVWVTFLTELATFNEKTVSVVGAVDPRDPAIRTFKLERKPAEGTAYALAVAEKHGVTYSRIKERIKP